MQEKLFFKKIRITKLSKSMEYLFVLVNSNKNLLIFQTIKPHQSIDKSVIQSEQDSTGEHIDVQ